MTSVTAVEQSRIAPSTGGERGTLRVGFLDGMRGLAALYVVFAHALQFNMPDGATAAGGVFSTGGTLDRALFQLVDAATIFSRYAVVLFIVLSGCSLMMPVARSPDGRLPGGFWNYAYRRARRILPPYYATLAISLVLIAIVPGMNDPSTWGAVPAFEADVLLSHLLLVHNWSPDWAYRINPPLWTIPIEWQIYFLFPFLLLPVVRRFGDVAGVVVGFGVGLAVFFAVGPERIVQSAPWFLGLFGLGMLGANLAYSYDERKRWRGRWLPGIILLLLGAFVVVAIGMRLAGLEFSQGGWVTDILFGAAVAVLIVHLGRVGRAWGYKSLMFRSLERKRIVSLGWFSYSLYLMHAPIVMVVALGARALDLPAWSYLPSVLVGMGAALVGTYLFHIVFERPFMAGHLRRPKGPFPP